MARDIAARHAAGLEEHASSHHHLRAPSGVLPGVLVDGLVAPVQEGSEDLLAMGDGLLRVGNGGGGRGGC
jgi:hypothetical protein